METMTDRAPFSSKLTSQQRSDAQINNPVSPITPTAPLEPTASPEELRTSDPTNGGIVP